MKTFKAALFDLDGTLFDTEGQYSVFWGKTCRRFRPEIDRLEYKIKGMTLVQIFDTYFPDPEVQAIITEGLNQWEMQMHYDWVPGAEEFIMDCRRHGVKCAVITSSNQMKMKAVAAQRPHFNDLFERILTSEDFSASKPAPDCYLLGAKVFGLDISECVVFEDAINGLQAGIASGIYTIGLTTTNDPTVVAQLSHHVINDFTGLDYEKVCELLN
ncbi:MAG: HAD family phosphatase [Bacteroidales bacterium]|nr:HAD family phosphatase [Bacteroidales bacterium]